ncbi:MAG: VOC family protein [Pseudomonadota bacterium]
MHRSKLGGLIIDCQVDDLAEAERFWTQALGYSKRLSDDPDDEGYVLLDTPADEPHIEIQQVSHPSRVHLDIETDNVEAEVARLLKLGAIKIEQVSDWWVLEAPTGHRFCVIPASRDTFGDQANVWE